MALRDEHADILGGPILQKPESGLFAAFSQYHFVFKSVVLLGLSVLVWIVGARGLEHLRKHRELRYRKAMRRKHGIPDSDCRPFAVAYAAAKRAHLEREDRKKMTNYVSDHNLPAVDQRTDAQKDARGLRRRVPENVVQPSDHQLRKHATVYGHKRSETQSLDFVDRYNPNARYRMTIPEPLPAERYPIRGASRKDLVMNNEESKKRSFEDESGGEHEIMKKSRIDRDDLQSGDEQADRALHVETSQRVFKDSWSRRTGGNDVSADEQEGYERVNGFQDEDHELVDEVMEGIDEGGATELKAVARGKKRDRVEAGSSFGGDDDDDDIRNGRVSHHRKRRSVLRRRIEVPARGQKRDREAESAESEGEDGDSEASRRSAQRGSKKKRGKRTTSNGVGEESIEDPRISKDSLCGGRRVGDKWEVDGIQYKVGDEGERLRLALIKKAKNKYHMPQDSQHPDRSAALEIYVETWVTDEQYKCAEERQELAWQEAPGESRGSKTPDMIDSPMQNGKNLLWDSVKASPVRHPSRLFMPTAASSRVNPFEQLRPTLGRRVASSSAVASPMLLGVTDSPTRPGLRHFSKWEKQDREADALARIRAKIEDQKAEVPQKATEVLASASAPELGTKPLCIPTITFTPAPVVAAGGHTHTTSAPQKELTTSTPFATSTINDSIKGVSAATTTAFSLPSTSLLTATPPTIFPVPTPSTATSSTSTAPNPFEKVTSVGVPSASATSPSSLGAIKQSQPPPTEDTSKLQSFSFAKPATFSFTSPAVATASSTTKPQVPDISVSPPSPAIPTPAIAKAEILVPSPALTSTVSDNPRLTTPFFSFSNASSSSSTATLQAPSGPKFSFGQPPATSAFMPNPNPATGIASQTKPTFKFGQALPDAKEGNSASVVTTADETKKSATPVSVFGATTRSNEPIKPLSFETAPTFRSASLPSTLAMNFAAKPTTVDTSASTSTLSKPALASPGITAANNILFSTPAGTSAPGNTPLFAFGGTNAGFKTGEGSKPTSSFGGAGTGGSNPVPLFGANSAGNKPTFTFTPPAEGSKPIFGGSTEALKPPVFGGSAGGSARSREGM